MACNRYTRRTYYTFGDCHKIIHGEDEVFPLAVDKEQFTFYDLYTNLFDSEVATATATILNGTESETLLGRYLFTKNNQMCVAYEDTDINEEVSTTWSDERKREVFGLFIGNMVNIFLSTYERYKKILDSYTAKANLLLAQIGSTNTSKTRFNDTPQDSDQTFFDDDEHATNVSINEQTIASDGVTPMQRLEEIRSLYANVYSDWANEFDSLFFEEQ